MQLADVKQEREDADESDLVCISIGRFHNDAVKVIFSFWLKTARLLQNKAKNLLNRKSQFWKIKPYLVKMFRK